MNFTTNPEEINQIILNHHMSFSDEEVKDVVFGISKRVIPARYLPKNTPEAGRKTHSTIPYYNWNHFDK